MLQALEARLEAIWETASGEARAEAEKALADLKAQLTAAGPVLTGFEAALRALLAAAEPQLKADAEALLAKLLADFAPLLGEAPSGG